VDLLAEADRSLASIVALRRRIHARPETGLELPETQRVVLDALADLGGADGSLEIRTGRSLSSVVAVVTGERPGPTTLLRADMDALELTEDTGLDFASTIPGTMHACGHDAHVAMLVGAIELLQRHRRQLAGRVVCMFQPGEEGYGGARRMLEEGLLDEVGPVDRAFAIHISPLAPSGWVASRPGPIMASADEFQFTVTGRGGHASMPHDAADPVPAACEIVTALQAMVTRTVPVFDPAVVTVATMEAAAATNVIPERVRCGGTIRAVSASTRQRVLDGLQRVVTDVAHAHGCTAEVALSGTHYPVTVNDPAAVGHVLAVAGKLLGPDRVVEMPTPVMGAEDWSYVLQAVPGCMAILGAAPPGVAHPEPNHSNRMVIDELALATGVALHAAVALS
jgi:amidohydrolase